MPLQVRIKGYYSSDVEDLATWSPTSLEVVYYPLELSIGIKDDDRADVFQILVATPEAIRSRMLGKSKCLTGRHILLVAEHDWAAITRYCESVVQKCCDDTWEKVSRRIARYFRWEFEDFIEVQE